MSTEELRQELDRIGDRAPAVDVPDDTFARAQRARRRDRLAVIGAVAVVLAIAGGLAAWLPDRAERQQPADTGGVGVPDVIHSVPPDTLTPTDDLAVGRAAVALLPSGINPVVIDATDGTYRALELPGFGTIQSSNGAVSLSPDGRQLAWSWSGDVRGPGPVTTGVRIADLETGAVRDVSTVGGGGVVVYTFTWSPDSRWLLWDGVESGRWGVDSWVGGAEAAGRIGPRDTASQPVPRTTANSTEFAVGDDGEVVIATKERVTWWDGTVLETRPRSGNLLPVVLTPEGGVLLEALQRGSDNFRIDFRVATPEGSVEAPALSQTELAPLGMLDDHTVVAMTGAPDNETSYLSLVDLDAGGTVREVGEIEGQFATVAVDLMTGSDPTVARPDPPWLEDEDGRSPGAKVATVVGLFGVLGLLARLWWRRRQALSAR